jgi:dsDNA-specific endonuclease/ATPase MutS2
MAQAGMPIPAAETSCLPVFDSVFADIGDEQSIEQTLSTFSWHMGNIVRIIRGTTRRSLVLLDELGTSTDPAEGSALARAILRHFRSRGTLTVATTHFSDLKAFAHITQGFENASLEFDPVTLTPTFCLTVGIPGGSNAMATAARLGIPAEIIDEARGMLTQGSQEMETLLANLMTEKQKMESLGTLAGGVAHDFSNILSTIIMNAEFGVNKLSLVSESLEILLKAASRAKDLVEQILTFSCKTEQILQPVSITPIAQESLKLLRASLPATEAASARACSREGTGSAAGPRSSLKP